jgi:hypothetical protein
MAFAMLASGAELPSVTHILGWLRMGSTDEIIRQIEKSAGYRSPRHYIFSELQKLDYMQGNHAN